MDAHGSLRLEPVIEEKIDVRKSIKKLEMIWDRFLTSGLIPQDDLRPMIVDSWKRCLSFEISPYLHKPKNLSRSQLQKLTQARDIYRDVIWPFIYEMEKLAEQFHFVVAFADQEGFILIAKGHAKLQHKLEELNFLSGANWSERYVGTNAIGTTLTTGQPTQIFHAEHYCKDLQRHTCTAVPIFDPFNNELIGVFDFVMPAENHQSHTFGMAIQTARCIELEIYRKEKEKQDIFRELSLEMTLNELDRGIIVVDSIGRIRRVNLKTLKYLNLTSDALINKNLEDVICLRESEIEPIVFHVKLPEGGQIFLNRKPILHRQRQIGSVILLEPSGQLPEKASLTQDLSFPYIIGRSDAFQRSLQAAEYASQFNTNVLITGPTGTGKEIMARYIHAKSHRRDKPFLALNCGSIPRELIGSELFGYEEGAFTGAHKNGIPSKFELANGGTLLLDEISEMPLESQVYLLRVIEERVLTHLGGREQIQFDVRIIVSSNKNLSMEVQNGRFRADLFYRIKVLHIDLPPLRDRVEDIPLLAEHFIEILSKNLSKKVTGISKSALYALKDYSWPGNIRELRNVLEQAIIKCLGAIITWEDLPEEIRNTISIPSNLQESDRERYLRFSSAYKDCKGNVTQMARKLNVSRPTIYAWLRKLDQK